MKNDLWSKKRRGNDKDICRTHPGCPGQPWGARVLPCVLGLCQGSFALSSFSTLSLPSLQLFLAGTRRTSKAAPRGASCAGQCSQSSAVPGTRASLDIGGEKLHVGSNTPVTQGTASTLQSSAYQIKAPSPASAWIFQQRAQMLLKQPDPLHRWQMNFFSFLETEPSLLFSSPLLPRCTPALRLSGKGQSAASGDELPTLWPEFTFLTSPATRMRIGA